MLYTDTELFFLYLFVEDLANKINACPHLRDAFDFSEISPRHLSTLGCAEAGLHAGEVNYFKDETNSDVIVEFVGLRSKMYLFTVFETSEPILWLNYSMNVRQKAVAKNVARSQIKRYKHKDYVQMFNGEALTNVVDCQIGSKLYYVRITIFIYICMTAH